MLKQLLTHCKALETVVISGPDTITVGCDVFAVPNQLKEIQLVDVFSLTLDKLRCKLLLALFDIIVFCIVLVRAAVVILSVLTVGCAFVKEEHTSH